MQPDALFDVMRTRRSIRRYADRPVGGEAVVRLLEAAIWAPSAHNRQPWRFVAIQTEAVKLALAEAMGARLRADRLADGDPPEAVEADAVRSRARMAASPVVVAVCLSMADMDSYPDTRRKKAEYLMAAQSVAMA
ncbi:MAG: nitroreductase family protein, partial [Chloroflexi bacterium]|nr:nitroreductase family protein [Chloroflexota bacterium]